MLNDEKSKIRVGDCKITSTNSVHNLGVYFVSLLNMEEFILKRCRHYQFQIHKIARICKYILEVTCVCLIQGLVMSKLDYANYLLVGINKTFLNNLQVVQNSAARVMKLRKLDHIGKVRQELHWLPIQKTIDFSVLINVYKVLHRLEPPFISELILLSQSSRYTRSSNSPSLAHPVKVPRKNYEKRAFINAAPALWNKLPVNIRSSKSLLDFRKQLKTYLFKHAYDM